MDNYTSVEITNCTVKSSITEKSSFLLIATKSLKCHLLKTFVCDTSGGISVKIKQPFFVSSWLQMHIVGCIFQNITKSTSGGSLSIQYFPSNGKWSTHNILQIMNTTFVGNKVIRKQLQNAYGGAVSLVSDNSFEGAIFAVEMHHVVFSDNCAGDGGGSLYVSGNFITIVFINCQFFVSDNAPFLSNPLFVLSYSTISMLNSSFVTPDNLGMTPLNELQLLSSALMIENIVINFKCPAWHWLDVSSDFGTSSITGEITLQKLTMKCASCPSSFYFYTEGNFFLAYHKATEVVQVLDLLSLSENLDCVKCPYGAACPGYQLNSKPNFWGFELGNQILFAQCPVGFCCSGETGNLCTSYNSCNNHREGTLCGACEKNYELSLLSNKCLPVSICDDSWVWPAAVLGTVFYMLWYTFKDDIISFLQYLVGRLMCANERETPIIQQHTETGYFGILIYFVQASAMMRIQIQQESAWYAVTVLQYATTYISLFLTVELKYFSFDVCSDIKLDATLKTVLNFLFYCGIFVSWLLAFISVVHIFKHVPRFTYSCSSAKGKMLHGLVEIIKYTYGGFTDIVFYSLAYTTISGEKVWFYDGTVVYFSHWQCAMIIFAIFHTLPFPLVLFLGLHFLRGGQISSSQFVFWLFVPLPALLFWIFLTKKQNNNVEENKEFSMSEGNAQMFDTFKGAYKETGVAPFWESVMIMRRLLLGSTALIPNSFLKLTVCILLCMLFFAHHTIVQPFHHLKSNKAEGLSLILLCLVALINAYKAMSISAEALDEFMNLLSLLEAATVPVLLLFIIVLETRYKYKERKAHIG